MLGIGTLACQQSLGQRDTLTPNGQPRTRQLAWVALQAVDRVSGGVGDPTLHENCRYWPQISDQ